MQFSPKLKRVMAEIQAILEREEIAGLVILHTPGHCEYNAHITPPYSCLKKQGNGYRLVSKLETHNGDKKAKQQQEANTANMLTLIGVAAGECSLKILETSESVNETFGIVDGEITSTPSNYWDN
jgi:hypothetical protein